MNKIRNIIAVCISIIFIILGALGVVTPIMPGLPFIITAAVLLSFVFPDLEKYVEKYVQKNIHIDKIHKKIHRYIKKFFK
jgi:uncharacterized membrane protein YbaN (DUF454 family)